MAIPSQGELTTSFSDSTPCESLAGETDCGFSERYLGGKIDRVPDEWLVLLLYKLNVSIILLKNFITLAIVTLKRIKVKKP